MARRPLPDSEQYARDRQQERRRRIRRAALVALLLSVLALAGYLLAGGELPQAPEWFRALLRGGSREGNGAAA